MHSLWYQDGKPVAHMTVKHRVLIIVQNLPVPFDRRVWLECQALTSAGYQVAVVCPKGKGDPCLPGHRGVEIYKYRPYAPGGSKLSFVAEYAYSFLATAWHTLKARRKGRFAVIQACNPPDIFWPIALAFRLSSGPSSSSITTTCARSSSSPASPAGRRCRTRDCSGWSAGRTGPRTT